MALTFHPNSGDVLVCDYNTGFHPPEMTKIRPVVIVSPRHRRGTEVVTVVPLSTSAPYPVEDYHHQIETSGLPGYYSEQEVWAKCDMVASVGLWRLDQIKVKGYGGKRTYHTGSVTPEDLQQIRTRVGRHIGLTEIK